MKHSTHPEYEVTGDLAEVETLDLLALIPPTLDGMIKSFFVDVITRLAALEESEKVREERLAASEEETARKDKKIAELEARLAEHEDFDARQRATDRRRITALETPALSQKTAGDHLDRLFSEMRRLSIRQTTTKDAARLLGVSKPLVKKLKPYLATDSRFVILRDPRHKQRHLIRLAGT